MTCVVAIVDSIGNIHMGSDSLASDTHSQTTMTEPKIFTVGEMLVGFSGSFRTAQLFQHAMALPDRTELQEDMDYLVCSFATALRITLLEGGAMKVGEGDETFEGEFIIGYRGRIYRIQNDFSIIHAIDDFVAIGAGGESASSVLFATKHMDLTPEERMNISLEATAYQITSVKAPFHFAAMMIDDDEYDEDEDVGEPEQ